MSVSCKHDGVGTGAATRRLTQDTTPLQFNVTLGGLSEISSDQASRIQAALSSSLTQPEAADVAVSSNTIVQDDQLTLIILVYPSSDADSATLQSELEAVATGNQFTDNLRAMDIPVTSVTVNSVKPQPASQSAQRAPVTGSSLAGLGFFHAALSALVHTCRPLLIQHSCATLLLQNKCKLQHRKCSSVCIEAPRVHEAPQGMASLLSIYTSLHCC
jgi:hypothetical protein